MSRNCRRWTPSDATIGRTPSRPSTPPSSSSFHPSLILGPRSTPAQATPPLPPCSPRRHPCSPRHEAADTHSGVPVLPTPSHIARTIISTSLVSLVLSKSPSFSSSIVESCLIDPRAVPGDSQLRRDDLGTLHATRKPTPPRHSRSGAKPPSSRAGIDNPPVSPQRPSSSLFTEIAVPCLIAHRALSGLPQGSRTKSFPWPSR